MVDVPRGEVRIFPHYALQVEPETTVPVQSEGGPKVVIRVERAKDREYRNRSEEEQKIALDAPKARSRSQRVDYRVLAGLK